MRAALVLDEELGTKLNDQLASVLVSQICQPRKIFIDVGAHIGSVLASVMTHDPSISVIAVEPVPQKAHSLAKRFPGAEVHECALGDRTGEVNFFIDTLLSGYSSLLSPRQSGATHAREIRVSMRKLDDLTQSDQVDVIKIDVEGAEVGVLKGGELLVTKCRPTILFESGPQEHPIYSKEEMWTWLNERNYSIFLPNRLAHSQPGLSLATFLDGHAHPRRTTNYFAVPVERRIELRDRARRILAL
jgi:FkbM family methyltransferase